MSEVDMSEYLRSWLIAHERYVHDLARRPYAIGAAGEGNGRRLRAPVGSLPTFTARTCVVHVEFALV